MYNSEPTSDQSIVEHVSEKIQTALMKLPFAEALEANTGIENAQAALHSLHSGADDGSVLHGVTEELSAARRSLQQASTELLVGGYHVQEYAHAIGIPVVVSLPEHGIDGTAISGETTVQYRTYHHIGNATFAGSHPWDVIRDDVKEIMSDEAVNIERLRDFATSHSELTERYAAEVATMHEALVADFGAEYAGTVICLLSIEDFNRAIEIGDIDVAEKAAGFVANGLVLLRVDEREIQMYGTRTMLRKGFHEMAHIGGGMHYVLASTTSLPQCSHGEYAFSGDRDYELVEENGLKKYDPETQQTVDELWEEVRAEGYAQRKMAERGELAALKGTGATNDVCFVPENDASPNVDQQTGKVNIPWKYALGAGFDSDGKFHLDYAFPVIGVYGVDLIDKIKPGFSDDLQRAPFDPAAHERMKATLDSIRPGLYKAVADKFEGRTSGSFKAGLVEILEALGVVDSPVQH